LVRFLTDVKSGAPEVAAPVYSHLKYDIAEGRGFIAVPTVALKEAVSRYQFRSLGQATDCCIQFHAITAERRIAHPAVQLVAQRASANLV